MPVLEAHGAAHPDGGPERVRAAAAHVFVRAALPGPGGELARVEPEFLRTSVDDASGCGGLQVRSGLTRP